MNTEQAKTISLFEILDKLGFQPVRKTKKDAYYHYPVKKKGKKGNLHVNLDKNVWFDHRAKKGGTIIDFAVTYLQDNNRPHTVSDALQFIETTTGYAKPIISCDIANIEEPYAISSFNHIEDPALIEEIEAKGILLSFAEKYLQEVNIYDANKKRHFLALALENDDEGSLVENKYFSEFIGSPPAVTIIRGDLTSPPYIHVFKDKWDYFSFLEYRNTPVPKYDALILNDYSCLPQCSAYFYQHGYRVVFTWLPNTVEGDKAIQELSSIFKREVDLVHRPMNTMYPPPFETFNQWWQEKKRKQTLSNTQ